MNLKRIHVVHYCHCDFAWTNTRAWHKKRYVAFFNRMLDDFNAGKDYKVIIDNTEHSFKVFEKYSPERMDELKKRVAEGKISVANGGAALVRPNNCGDELFIRNMQRGKDVLEEKTGGKGRSFLNADTGFGHGQLPQILKNGGYDLYRFYRPCMALDLKGIPREFIYKGIDGSEIFVTRGLYDSSMIKEYKNPDFSDEKKVLETFKKEVIDPILPLQKSEDLVIMVGGDDVMPLHNPWGDYEAYLELIELWNRTYPDIKMSFSTLDEYLANVEHQSLPVVEGVIDPCELFYNINPRGGNSIWQKQFEGDRELVSLEYAATMAEKLGYEVDWEKIQRFWDRLIEFSGHAINSILKEDYDRILANSESLMAEIARYKHDVMEMICENIGCGKDNEYVIFNFSGREVTGNVPVHITHADNITGFKIKDAEGRELPYQVTEVFYGDRRFKCDFNEIEVVCRVTVPPMSAMAIYVEFDGTHAENKAEPENVKDFVIDNGKIRLGFKDGKIKEIITKKGVISAGKTGIGDVKLYNTRIGESWCNLPHVEKMDEYVAEKCVLTENGPLRYKVVTEGKIANHGLRQTITLNKGSNKIDFKTEIWVQKGGFEGYFTAGFPCDMGEFYSGIPYGNEKRALENEIYAKEEDLNSDNYFFLERLVRYVHFSKHFTAHKAGEEDVAVFQGNCGIYNRLTEGGCELYLMRAYKAVTRRGTVEDWIGHMSEHMNGEGYSSFTYSYAAGEGDLGELHRMAREIERPLVSKTRYFTAKADRPDFSLFEIKEGNIVLTAAYTHKDEKYMRFFVPGEEATKVSLKLNYDVNEAYICDFEGNKKRDVQIKDNIISFDARGYEIITIKAG